MTKDAYTFRYRVRHWSRYNPALMARGGITFWIDEAALTTWRNTQTCLGAGAPRIYSDTAIHCAVVVKSVYRLSLRAAQGFVSSERSLMHLDLPVSNSSTGCRRQGTLPIPIFSSSKSQPRHLVIDSTGLRVYGAGEWHVQKHRGARRRRWRKLHLGVDEQTREIVAELELVSDLLKLSNCAAVRRLPRLHPPVRLFHRRARGVRQLSQV